MSKAVLIHHARIINEGKIEENDLLIKDGRIERIGTYRPPYLYEELDARGLFLIPGIIDDQVHFRQPGLTYKADIGSESRACLAGGVTSFMEMPNTIPAATTLDLVEQKFQLAATESYGNYSFYLGASDHNLDEIKKISPQQYAGVKIFMGSSTGDLLVQDEQALEAIFQYSPTLIATHCEDEPMYRQKLEEYKIKYCDDIPASCHEFIRSAEGCLKSSSKAVGLARRFNSRLHILHLSTEEELVLFSNLIPLNQKRITAEVCVHHLYFDSSDYQELNNKIKCNPSIKDGRHRRALFSALKDDRLDIIATDHAPHTLEEKSGGYLQSASGLPLVQHSLQIMLDFYHQGMISLEMIVDKMCHAPAVCFQVEERGFIREGYFADLCLLDTDDLQLVLKDNIYYKCGWSPLENRQFRGIVKSTWVNGELVFNEGNFKGPGSGQRLRFNR